MSLFTYSHIFSSTNARGTTLFQKMLSLIFYIKILKYEKKALAFFSFLCYNTNSVHWFPPWERFCLWKGIGSQKKKGEINMSTKGLWKHVLITEGAVESPKECLLDKLAASLHVSTREFHTKMTSLGFHLPDFLSSEN